MASSPRIAPHFHLPLQHGSEEMLQAMRRPYTARYKVDGTVVRQRGAVIRAMGAAMAVRFRGSQAGTQRRALTVDDGRSAVTDNYVKVSLGDQRPRNTWVQVAI